METAEQTEAFQILPQKKSHNINKIIRNMADVCEAFCLFRVFCGLPPKFVSIRGSQIIQHSAFNIQH